MHSSYDLPSWITTMYFCPLTEVPGKMLLASHSGGVRGPTNAPLWWPQIVGREAENLGSILVVEQLPVMVDLGMYMVAYGTGLETLRILMTPDEDRATVLLEYHTKVRFTPPPYGSLPGVAALQLAVRNCTVRQPGLYWLSAAIGEGPLAQLPLYIEKRGD